ncbi:QRFP-like peptide receptor [Agrilus planipennis]|uniref:QRFP-like peptide receptor n=1 Tax=Agrilus planipennis TaxID=224129 RepID=A0A1W4WRN8_AGRPL|nr:QRFP-like peptide receptor [Agrilus planipennis]
MIWLSLSTVLYEVNEYEYEEDYEYNFSESHSTFYWEELLPTVLVYGVTLLLGLTGNSLIVFTTYRYRRMQSSTNVLLASLASADLLLIIFCIPVKVAKLFSYTWAMGAFLCKTVHYMQNVSTICSVLTLTAISIERYYAIVHPMKAKYICTISQAKKIIILTWMVSFLLGLPILFVQIQMPVGDKNKAYWCVRNWDNISLWRFNEIYILLLVFICPSIIMSFAYSFICWEVWRVMERRSIMTSRDALSSKHSTHCKQLESFHLTESSKRSEYKIRAYRDDTRMVKQVIYMLVTVVVLFIVCWGPVLIDNVLTAYGQLPIQRTGNLKYMATAFHLMAYFNSCINPIIYGFMSKNFRESFQLALCCKLEPRSTKIRSSRMVSSFHRISRSGSQTRTTSLR